MYREHGDPENPMGGVGYFRKWSKTVKTTHNHPDFDAHRPEILFYPFQAQETKIRSRNGRVMALARVLATSAKCYLPVLGT